MAPRRPQSGVPRNQDRVRVALPNGAPPSPTRQSPERGWPLVRSPLLLLERPLFAPFAASWLALSGIGILLYSPALRVYRAGELARIDFTRDTAYALAPDFLLAATRQSWAGLLVAVLYLTLAAAALAAWCWGVRAAANVNNRSPLALLVLTGLLAVPAVGYVGLFSDDVFLYNLYGRTISTYGANPILQAPSAFAWDPHLTWVYWKDLPSAYGPLWLMWSALISGLAADSISAVVLGYRLMALAVHLATAAAIWYVVRYTAPRDAAAATLFYAWNPLVMLELVANAHNDGLVALFGVLLVAASLQRAWGSAAFFGACAVLVKPFAVLLLPGLALRIYQTSGSAASFARRTTGAILAGAITIVVVSLPLYAGLGLLANIETNPASHMYTNTLWEMFSGVVSGPFGLTTIAVQHPYLDALRTAAFLLGVVWILNRRWARRGVAHVALPLWIVFVLTASWVWPWYFVPAIALASVARGSWLAVAAGLTAGGMIFWAAWPSPSALPGLDTIRAALLFGPLVATLLVPAVRLWILDALGAGWRPDHDRPDLVNEAVSSAAGQPSSAHAAS